MVERAETATELADVPLLVGRYRYLRELGRGASGRVIVARDEADGGVLRALKVVPPAHAERLRWEFDTLSRVAHPHLSGVHELLSVERPVGGSFRLEAGTTVLVEQLAEGDAASSVADVMRRRGEPEAMTRWVVTVGEAVARALSAIHGAGLVHGDVKPDNIVVDADGNAILIDLGLAGPPGLATGASGTPGFMAPEAWQGERSAAADAYALGATLHALLGGHGGGDASRSKSVTEQLAAALSSPRTADSLEASVPASLRRLIGELLEPDPSSRLGIAREVAARLSSIASELGVGGRTGGGLEDAPTPKERALSLSTLPFVGRAEELTRLTRAISEGGVLAVTGPPGAGRTRLVREAVRRLQSARVAASSPAPTYLRTQRELPVVTPRHDVVLHVEDADAIEPAGARAFVSAVDVEGARAAVVLERHAPVDDATPTIELGPIDDGALAELLRSAIGADAAGRGRVAAARRGSGGLPGRLCRGLMHAIADGSDPRRREVLEALAGGDDASPVPAQGRDLAELLAVAGGSLTSAAACSVLSNADVASGFDTLAAAGVASVDDDGALSLRPDARRDLLESLSAKRRSELARALVDCPLPDDARGFVDAALGRNAEALDAFVAEARRLREHGAPGRRALLCARARRVLDAESVPLRLEQADALRALGRYEEALSVLDGVETSAAAVARADLHRLRGELADAAACLAEPPAEPDPMRSAHLAVLARVCLDRGEVTEARRHASAAVAGADPLARSRALEVLAYVDLMEGDLTASADHVASALRAAREARDRGVEARVRSVEATIALRRGEVMRAASLYAQAFELADAVGELHAAASFLTNVGLTRLDAGEPGPAIAALRDGARRLARLDRDRDLCRALYNLGLAAVLVGDDDLGRTAVRRARKTAERCGDTAVHAFAEVLLGELALRAGTLARTRDHVARAAELAVEAAPDVRTIVHARRALLLSAAGDHADARVALDAATAAVDGGVTDDAVVVEHAVAQARLSLAAGDVDTARLSAGRARLAAERNGAFEARLRAALASADAAEAAGDAASARQQRSLARTLLDAASATLDPAARVRLRRVPEYRRALGEVPTEPAPVSDDRWRRLAFYARRMTAERRLGRLYEEILDAAVDLSGAERGFIVLRDDDGSLRVRVARGLGRRDLGREELRFSRSLAARAIDGGRVVTTVDALADEQLGGARSVHALALRSVLAVPLRRREGAAGAIYLDDRLRPGAFGPGDEALMADLSDLASIALDGAEALRAERRQARRLSVLQRRLARTVESQALQIETLRRASVEGAVRGIIAESEPMRRALELVRRVADSDVPALVTGESGTGKELVARAIHDLGARREQAFISENCSAIPESLLESALFGHVRGAFTGADRTRLGLFEAAHRGTLFLDEIGEMSPAMQSKLLRAVQDGVIRPVGSERTIEVDVRIVAATHRDLEALVEGGRFREDLYYRLAVVTIDLPPLRDRPQDIPPLVAHLLSRHAGDRDVRVDRRALSRLTAFGWPGNVRQLENEIQRALVLATDVIREEHLSPAVVGDGEDAPDELDLKGQLAVLERRLIKTALQRCTGNQTRAAKLLGVSRYGLQKMIKRLEIEP